MARKSAAKARSKKAGRPPAIVFNEETQKALSGLAQISCTTKEGAAFFHVSEPTFLAFLKRNPKAREIWDTGPEFTRMSLRRWQMAAASKGSTAMLIWLGKQHLGQKDKSEVENVGKDGGPIQNEFTVKFVTASAST